MVNSSDAKITFAVAEIILKCLWSLLRWSKSLLKNGSRGCKSNNKDLYYIRLTWARSPACIHTKHVGNCSNGGIQYKLSALLYISYLAEVKYYESMLKPLIVTFPFFWRYIHFFKQTEAILYFCHFPYNIRFLLNIALILLDDHYLDAESSEKNQLLQAKCTKLHFVFCHFSYNISCY